MQDQTPPIGGGSSPPPTTPPIGGGSSPPPTTPPIGGGSSPPPTTPPIGGGSSPPPTTPPIGGGSSPPPTTPPIGGGSSPPPTTPPIGGGSSPPPTTPPIGGGSSPPPTTPRGKVPTIPNSRLIVYCEECEQQTLMTSHNKIEHVFCCNPTCSRNKKTWHGMQYKQEHFTNWRCFSCGGVLARIHPHDSFTYEQQEDRTEQETTTSQTYAKHDNYDVYSHPSLGGTNRTDSTRLVHYNVMVSYNNDIPQSGWSHLYCITCNEKHIIATRNNRLLKCDLCNKSLHRKKDDQYECTAEGDTCSYVHKSFMRVKRDLIPLTNIKCAVCDDTKLQSIDNGKFTKCTMCNFVQFENSMYKPKDVQKIGERRI